MEQFTRTKKNNSSNNGFQFSCKLLVYLEIVDKHLAPLQQKVSLLNIFHFDFKYENH